MPHFSLFLQDGNNNIPLTHFETHTPDEYVSEVLKARGFGSLQMKCIKFRITNCRYETTVHDDIMVINNANYEVYLSEEDATPPEPSRVVPPPLLLRDLKQEYDPIGFQNAETSQQAFTAPVTQTTSAVTHFSPSAPPSKLLKISKSVTRAVLPEALSRLTLDTIASKVTNPKVTEAVQIIKAGQIPTDRIHRIPMISVIGHQLLRHCIVENSPSAGETGAFFLHLMDPYPHMRTVYNDWTKKLCKYSENARRTLKKRGLISSKDSDAILPEVNQTYDMMYHPPSNNSSLINFDVKELQH